MSNVKKIDQITEQQINATGVVSLATRPNQRQANSQYGVGGLSAKELQKRFDNLARLAIGRYNVLAQLLAGTYESADVEAFESILEYILAIKGDTESNTVGDLSLKDVLDKILTANGDVAVTDPFTNKESTIDIVASGLYSFLKDNESMIEDVSSRVDDNSERLDGVSSRVDSLEESKINVSDVVNNLVTNDSQKPLSAAQGVALRRMIETSGGGSGGSGGGVNLAWSPEYFPNRAVWGFEINALAYYDAENDEYRGVRELRGARVFNLYGNYDAWQPINVKVEGEFVPICTATDYHFAEFYYNSVDGVWEASGVPGFIEWDNWGGDADKLVQISRWLQPTEDISTALDELHEYAQGIISGVSE